MQISQVIAEIETYLSVYHFEGPVQKHSLVVTLPQTHRALEKHALFVSDADERDDMINAILEHCDTSTLEELVSAYGEDSPIARAVRKRTAYADSKVDCNLGNIGQTLEQTLLDARKGGNPFYETVCRHIDRLGYHSDADFYNSISMPRQQFARLRDAANTLSKKTVLWIIAGLRLDYPQASDLLQKAGYQFRKNDMRDVILSYIFRNTTYDLDMVNQVLDHFGLQPLC